MQTDIQASTHLGKISKGSSTYDNSLLVAVSRDENRKMYGLKSEDLPFKGEDIWHSYEFSAMTENGLPVTKLIKLKYDCNSPFIVESKSLKLYLNSFNMTGIGKTFDECLKICKSRIEKDLSDRLQADVIANFIDENSQPVKICTNYEDIMQFVDEQNIKITEFKENPKLLAVENCELKEYRLKFGSLRSNCRVTHQPDFGDVFIYYKSSNHIKEDSLLKYLVSFRKEYHFHEECVEMIFKRLSDILNSGDELCVCALYTRRGGIDINPVRYSKNCFIKDFDDLQDVNLYTRGGIKQ